MKSLPFGLRSAGFRSSWVDVWMLLVFVHFKRYESAHSYLSYKCTVSCNITVHLKQELENSETRHWATLQGNEVLRHRGVVMLLCAEHSSLPRD